MLSPKITLSLVFLFFFGSAQSDGSLSIVPSVKYDELRHQFKCALFEKQKKLISNWARYTSVTSGFISEAEEKLEAVKYCKDHPEAQLSCDILNALVTYNTLAFQCYCVQNEHFKNKRDDHLKSMRPLVADALAVRAKEKAEKLVSVDNEMRSIQSVIEYGVEHYYHALSWSTKLQLQAFLKMQGLL